MRPVMSVALDVAALARTYRIPVQSVQLVRDRTVSVEEIPSAHCAESVAKLLHPFFDTFDREVLAVLALDAKNRVRGIHACSVGGQTSCFIDKRTVLRYAVLSGATGIILAHNHPSGDPTPSRDDIHSTRAIQDACHAISIPLVDHLIVTHETHYSMLEGGHLDADKM